MAGEISQTQEIYYIMRRLSFQLIIALFVFAVSNGTTWPAGLNVKSEWSITSLGYRAEPLSSVQTRTRKKRKFKLVSRSSESGSYEGYESSDGQEVSLIGACYTSTAPEARQEMQRMISEGRVVQRGWRHYGHGRHRRLGKRTVAIYPKDESGEKPAKIFWYVDGPCFSYIEAGSLQLALDFERSDQFAKAQSY
ncbi:MAG TPA: hypothetical protein VGJ66_02905 [Pyrinomonadaceae bacterium]